MQTRAVMPNAAGKQASRPSSMPDGGVVLGWVDAMAGAVRAGNNRAFFEPVAACAGAFCVLQLFVSRRRQGTSKADATLRGGGGLFLFVSLQSIGKK